MVVVVLSGRVVVGTVMPGTVVVGALVDAEDELAHAAASIDINTKSSDRVGRAEMWFIRIS